MKIWKWRKAWIAGTAVGLLTWTTAVFGATSLPVTPLSLQILTNTTAAGMRSALGILNSNFTANAGQFVADSDNVLNLKPGVQVTNPAIVGTIGFTNNATLASLQTNVLPIAMRTTDNSGVASSNYVEGASNTVAAAVIASTNAAWIKALGIGTDLTKSNTAALALTNEANQIYGDLHGTLSADLYTAIESYITSLPGWASGSFDGTLGAGQVFTGNAGNATNLAPTNIVLIVDASTSTTNELWIASTAHADIAGKWQWNADPTQWCYTNGAGAGWYYTADWGGNGAALVITNETYTDALGTCIYGQDGANNVPPTFDGKYYDLCGGVGSANNVNATTGTNAAVRYEPVFTRSGDNLTASKPITGIATTNVFYSTTLGLRTWSVESTPDNAAMIQRVVDQATNGGWVKLWLEQSIASSGIFMRSNAIIEGLGEGVTWRALSLPLLYNGWPTNTPSVAWPFCGVTNNTIRNIKLDFTTLSPTNKWPPLDKPVYPNGAVTGNGACAIALMTGDNIRFERCTFTPGSYMTVFLYDIPNAYFYDCVFFSNTGTGGRDTIHCWAPMGRVHLRHYRAYLAPGQTWGNAMDDGVAFNLCEGWGCTNIMLSTDCGEIVIDDFEDATLRPRPLVIRADTQTGVSDAPDPHIGRIVWENVICTNTATATVGIGGGGSGSATIDFARLDNIDAPVSLATAVIGQIQGDILWKNQWTKMPTNSIPTGSNAKTNWATVNVGGVVMMVATNYKHDVTGSFPGFLTKPLSE